MDEVVPEGTHEATPEAGNDLTALNIDVTETEGTLQDIHSSLSNESTPVPLPLEHETETELVPPPQANGNYLQLTLIIQTSLQPPIETSAHQPQQR
jgi:hypothetical protein